MHEYDTAGCERRCGALRAIIIALAVGVAAASPLGCDDGGRAGAPFADTHAGLPGSYFSCAAWGDYDGDGDLDVALILTSGSKIFRNEGGAFVDTGNVLAGTSIGTLAWGDYDGDGDLDLALTGGESFMPGITRIYRNDGGVFSDIVAAVPDVAESCVAWGDVDSDGDLDLALCGGSAGGNVSGVYQNDGGVFTEVISGLMPSTPWWLAWGDYDVDGDMDLAVTGTDVSFMHEGYVYNNMYASLTDSGSVFPAMSGPPAWGDYDNDGDLDIALMGSDGTSSVTSVYFNSGGAFYDGTGDFAGVSGYLACGDYDNDGDLDLAVAGQTDNGPACRIHRNDGGAFTAVAAHLTGVSTCCLAWGDYDNDGDLDLFVTGETINAEYIARIYRNNHSVPNTPPSIPSGLSGSPAGAVEMILSWLPATDAETPAAALTYNLRVGTTPGGNDVMPGMSIVGGPHDGRRLLPAMGNVQLNTTWIMYYVAPGTYYWSVQAVDSGFMGGPWATEETVVIF